MAAAAMQAPAPNCPVQWHAEALWLRLQTLLPGLSIEVLPSASSTNTLLLERLRSGVDREPCLLVAEQQTAGRGRLGRLWRSDAGASLTFSLALPLTPADWSGLSLAVGVALADALDPPRPDVAPRIGLKWPNDLWLLDGFGRGRKLGGILIETVNADGLRFAVVGIGLNLLPLPEQHADAFSQGHASVSEIDAEVDAPHVLALVAEPLLHALLEFQRAGFAPQTANYARRDVLRGLAVTTTLVDLPDGRATGVDEQGALLLQRHGVAHRVLSGEVSVRLQRAGAA